MKIFSVSIAFLLWIGVQQTIAQNIVSIADQSVVPEQVFYIEVGVENSDPFVAIQFDLAYQNDEFMFDKDASGLTERANGHSISITQPFPDVVRVVAYSVGQVAFGGSSGSIIKLAFNAPEKDGEWDFTLSDAILGNAQSVNILDEVQNGQVSVGGFMSVNRPLNQGWTWFSVNVDIGSLEIADVLGSIRPTHGLPASKCDKELSNNKSGIIVNPADFEYSGQVTAAVFLDELNVGSADNELIAWVDGEARGIAKGLYFSPKEHWVYSLMIYSNQAEGDTVEFSFYDAGSQEQISFNEQLIFVPDMIIKDAEEPYELRELSSSTLSLGHLYTQSLTVFPNPVNHTATISFTLTQSQQVTFDIINIFGQVVDRINQGVMPEGIHQISWSTEKLDGGVYMVLKSDNPSIFQKVILLK